MAPVDREDRAAKAKARAAKVAVRRKRKPLPAADMEATLRIPHVLVTPAPKPVQRSVVFKPGPKAASRVKPVLQKESALDVAFTPKRGSTRAKQIDSYNQAVERQRRADAKAAREAQAARRAEVLRLDPSVRKMIGSDRLHSYIQEGPQQHNGIGHIAGGIVKGIGAAALHGAEALPGAAAGAVADFTSHLSAGLQGRKSAPVAPEDNPLVGAASDLVVGTDLVKALRGEPHNRWLALGELAMLPIPIKGLPTSVTAILRGSVGAARLARAARAGETVADVVREAHPGILETLTKPISEVKAEHAASLVKAAEAAGHEGPVPSSKLAGILAGKGQGRVARAIRNDLRAVRRMKVGETYVNIPADLSRTGKVARKGLDAVRDLKLVPLRSQETLGMRRLGEISREYQHSSAALEHALDNAMPRGWRKNVDWPAVYAVRSVAKGIPIEDSIRKTAENVEKARESGSWLEEQANRTHLAFFEEAQKYVTTDAAGHPVLLPDAPPALEKLRSAIEQTSGKREQILSGLEQLADETAKGRIVNEQLHYADAMRLPSNDSVMRQIRENPMRKQVADIWFKHDSKHAPASLALIDAANRAEYDRAVQALDEQIAEYEGFAKTADLPALRERHLKRVKELKAEKAALDPAPVYNSLGSASDVLPKSIIDAMSERAGRYKVDWNFSIYDSEDEVSAASKRIADEIIASGMPLPPEWDTPEKIHEGIHEVFKLARDGEFGKDWYQEAADGVQLVSNVTGVDPKTVAQLFAIYSQAADTIANSTFVFKAIRDYQKYGDLFVGRFPTRQSEEALSVLKGGTWDGRKRSSFYANILRHIPGQEKEYADVIAEMAAERGAPITHPVTVDRWVVRMFRPEAEKDVPERYYDAFESIMQKMAEHVGWEPEQIQAAAWVAKKAQGFEEEMAKAGGKITGTLRNRLDAGAGDAFQYGIERQIAKWGEPVKGDSHPQARRLANQANKKWGGFTVDKNLRPVPEEGYSVSYSLTEKAFKLHGLKGADIEAFRDEYEGLLKDARNKIGGFSDDLNEHGDGSEKTLLSITRHFKTKSAALKFAREQGQETVYEYKTGDGIRTGLTRYEQRAIIDALDPAHLKGGPVRGAPKLLPEEQEYQDFLTKAAKELGFVKPTKKGAYNVTPVHRNRTEEWLTKNADRYADEPLIDEWYDISARQSTGELPWWMQEIPSPEVQVVRDATPEALYSQVWDAAGEPTAQAEEILAGAGREVGLSYDREGMLAAEEALKRGEIPHEFIDAAANSPLHIYDKLKVGRYLDEVSGRVLKDWAARQSGAVQRMFPERLGLAGLYEKQSRALYFSEEEGHPLDWIHEFLHHMQYQFHLPKHVQDALWTKYGATPGAKLTSDQAEDIVDDILAHLLAFDSSTSDLPREVKDAIGSLRSAVGASTASGARSFTREHEALALIPEGERNWLEDILMYDPGQGERFSDGFQPKPGSYVPEKRGTPFRFGSPLAPRRTATLWYRMLSGKRIQTLTESDKHLSKQFKGVLDDSGLWEKDVRLGPLEGLLKAFQIQKMHDFRDVMIKAGKATPDSERDIMIPLEPKKWTDKTRAEVRNVLQIMDTMEKGMTVDRLALSEADAAAIEQVKQYLFPGLGDGQAEAVADLARQAMQKPIDGVVWVNRDMLEKSQMFEGAAGIPKNRWLRYGMDGADTANNIMKMLTLSLNPGYYPMNMAGQAIMLGSQLGFSAPFSLARSLQLMRALDDGTTALVDRFSGIGFAGSQMLSKGGALRKTTDTVGKVGTFLIDKYPRRVSFLHEARRLGYNTPEKVKALVEDLKNWDDLMTVNKRVNRAMVDYGNLNRFEKEWVSRLVFVYPWLRGSGRYTAQFPFDHPVQAALFAGLVYWQQNRLREALPSGHPGYMKWFMPLGAGKPGENPYGFRMDQLFTPLQTLDLASMLVYWGTDGSDRVPGMPKIPNLPWGSNEEGMASMLGPLAEEIEKTITGWDSFTQQEVSHGLPDLLWRIINPQERWASWDRLDRIMKHRVHTGLYDTNQHQNWLRMFLGSLAPINVDAEKAGEMAARQRGTPSAKQTRDAYIKKVEELGGHPLSDEEKAQISSWKEADQTYRQVSRAYRDEHKIEGESTIQQRAAMMVLAYGELHPEAADRAKRAAEASLHASDDQAQEAYDAFREELGLTKLARIDGAIRKVQSEKNKAAQEAGS